MSHADDLHGHADDGHGEHGHGEHGHMPFLAHHFDDPEQQYDSGKLGIWLFLVTEVLFFSGMFCAYALYRSRNPEVWEFSSQFLNATLGAFNTGVLLFSSLTMAWGVRCAQLRQRTGLVVALAMTLGCASIFLGVKAVEYTHKWDMGLLPAGAYESQYLPLLTHHEGLSSWLIYLSIVPAICVVGFAVWYGYTLSQNQKRESEVAGPMLVTALCFFVGVAVGLVFQSIEEKAHDDHTTAAAGLHEEPSHAVTASLAGPRTHAVETHGTEANEPVAAAEAHDNQPAADHASPVDPMFNALYVSATSPDLPVAPGEPRLADVDQKGGAGLFFSIYYCMTGVHAVHILGGMVVLTWLLVRATKDHFNEQYFGPVDYVGLYWHLVDLIWIYLFPLLYLI